MLKKKNVGKISNNYLSFFVKDHKQAVIKAGFSATLYYDDDEEKCSTELYSDDKDYFAYFNYGNINLSEDDDVYSSDS